MTQFACPRCEAGDLALGTIQSTGTVSFRLQQTKFMTFHTADVNVQAYMCASCGAITLLGDVEKLRLIKNKPAQKCATGSENAV
jgi:hypothetical protein